MKTIQSAFASRSAQWVLIAAAILGLIIGLDTLVLHLQLDPLADVRAYYDAGARLNAGKPLYEQPATTDDAGFYRYPPLLAIAFRPLALLPFETAALIWEALLIAMFMATLVRMGLRDHRTWIITGLLAAPIGWGLAVGQAQVAVTFLVAVGAPWAIALAGHLKILPILVAVYWLGRRDLGAVVKVAAWTGGLAALSFVLEPNGTIAFLTFSDLGQVAQLENRSLFAVSPVLWVASILTLVFLSLRFANTRAGWPLAVVLSIFATPRVFLYQTSTLQAAVRRPGASDSSQTGQIEPS